METRRSSAIEQAVLLGLISAYVLVAGGVIALPRHLPKQAPTEVVLGLLAGLAVHELAHALAAVLLGDDTPRREGRLTLNPLAHLHPVGTLLILGIGVGWARPVAFDSTALRARKWGVAIVKAAGPVRELARTHGLSLPISEEVYLVLHEEKPPRASVESLMLRGRKDEREDLF